LKSYPPAAAAAAAKAAGDNGHVYATLKYGDWLLWEQQRLTGRVAFDARVELLTTPQIASIADVVGGRISPDVYRSYQVFVVDAGTPTVTSLRACTVRTVYAAQGVAVLAGVRPRCLR
jgi:hypothetical protein